MATTLAAFGLIPVDHAGGGTVRNIAVENGINSAYNITLFNGTPVQMNASGQIVISTAAGPLIGTFQGYYLANQGNQNAYNVSPTWVSGTALASGSTAVALVTMDPQIEYEIQCSGSVTQSGTLMQGNIAFVGSGNSTTKQSQAAIGALSSVASGALRVMGLARIMTGSGNVWGDAFTILRVQIANHTTTAQRSPNV